MVKQSKSVIVLTGVLVAMLVLSVFTLNAEAGNSGDQPYSYSFHTNTQYTTPRAKLDSTSCYMYYQTGTISYTARVYGTNTANSTSNAYNCSMGYYYSFTSSHEKRYMWNNVYGLRSFATIKGAYTGTGTASGQWSPDSVTDVGVLPGSDYVH